MNKYSLRGFRKFELDKLVLVFCILIYFIIGVSLIQNYLYIIDPDGISYIHVAQHYINGRFFYAVNGYWGPLYSWLLIPFLMVWQGKLQALFSIKLLSLIIGCFTIFGVYLLADKLNFNTTLKAVTLVTLIPSLLYFTFYNLTPDLLVLTILLFYLNFLLDDRYFHSLRMGALAGFCGALAFLSKSYGFFFFLVHFIIVNADYWLRFKKYRKNITKNFVLGVLVFLLISGVWIALISEKYDTFTIGTSGSYNSALCGPESQGHPYNYMGLMKPWDEYALSVWDDPSYLKVKSWSPFSSLNNFYWELDFITYNMLDIFKKIESFSILSILIIFLAFFLSFKSSNVSSKNKLRFILLTIFIYSAGYLLFFIANRYLWFVDVLMLLLGVFTIKIASEEYSINKNISMMLLFILCLSFIFYPVFNLYDVSGKGEETYNLAENLKEYGVQGSNIASSVDWMDTLYLSYYLDAKYYGLTKTLSSEKEISEGLHRNNIEYYILWSNESMDIPGYEKLKDLDFDYPKVYRLSSG